MKITIAKQNQNNFELLIEREQGLYNNCNLSVKLSETEIEGLTKDEINTLAWLKVKSIATRVFEQIEPLNETDNPIDFILVPSKEKRMELHGSTNLTVGATAEYQAVVYDQYNQIINDVELTWNNKVITASVTGEVVVTVSLGDLSKSLVVNIVERIKTEKEILQELVDALIVDNLRMQGQIDTLITSSLGV